MLTKSRIRLGTLALLLVACGSRGPRLTTEGMAWVPLHPRTHEPAIAALVLSHGMPKPGTVELEEHPLAVAVWADGTLIRSAAAGGAYGHPYWSTDIGAQACKSIAARIHKIMQEREGNQVSYGIPDSSSELLLVREGDRVWRMDSCIDLFEENPKLVAMPFGVGVRDGMPAQDPNDPEERQLREFRQAWRHAKESLLSASSETGSELNLVTFEFAAIGAKPR